MHRLRTERLYGRLPGLDEGFLFLAAKFENSNFLWNYVTISCSKVNNNLINTIYLSLETKKFLRDNRKFLRTIFATDFLAAALPRIFQRWHVQTTEREQTQHTNNNVIRIFYFKLQAFSEFLKRLLGLLSLGYLQNVESDGLAKWTTLTNCHNITDSYIPSNEENSVNLNWINFISTGPVDLLARAVSLSVCYRGMAKLRLRLHNTEGIWNRNTKTRTVLQYTRYQIDNSFV